MSEERRCGTCRHFVVVPHWQPQPFGKCSAPVPECIEWDNKSRWAMMGDDGKNCNAWEKKQ